MPLAPSPDADPSSVLLFETPVKVNRKDALSCSYYVLCVCVLSTPHVCPVPKEAKRGCLLS